MEEILASIRRIIAEDGKPEAEAEQKAGAPPAEDVLLLTELVEEKSPPAAAKPGAAEAGLAQKTEQKVEDSFAELVRAMQRESGQGQGTERRSPLEPLVLEALRPALREWLDRNLAPIVERVVRDEIRRLAKRAELQ